MNLKRERERERERKGGRSKLWTFPRDPLLLTCKGFSVLSTTQIPLVFNIRSKGWGRWCAKKLIKKNTWWDKFASSCLNRKAKEKKVGRSRGKFAVWQKNGTLLLFNKKGNKRKGVKNIAANQGWKAKSSILDSVVPKPKGQFRIQEAYSKKSY